jgi:hypothetical protein
LSCVLGTDQRVLAEISLALRVLGGEDVAVVRFFPFYFSALENREPFGRTAACFQLGHGAISLLRVIREGSFWMDDIKLPFIPDQ